MKARGCFLFGLFVFLLMTLFLKAPGHADLINPSFENQLEWTLSFSGRDFYAYYATDWASHGSQNFTFYREAGDVYAGSYAQISQTVDLSDVLGIYFDCRDTGIDGHVVFLRFLIDGNVIGSWGNQSPFATPGNWGQTMTTLNIYIPFNTSYSGNHAFAIQAYNNETHWPADPKIYRIDNLRLDKGNAVPEPASVLLLGCGLWAIYALGRKKVAGKSSPFKPHPKE